jgi:hypothetical protein
MLWPEARIVLCTRDPLDVAMSCYTRYFAKGQPFSWSLPELGEYLVEHEQLMRHWRSAVTDNLFEVRYEELIEAQEDISRHMIEFAGLSWDDRCLEFHKTDRRIRTNPLAVRKPIYRSSIKRWKRFEPWIGPLKDALSDS